MNDQKVPVDYEIRENDRVLLPALLIAPDEVKSGETGTGGKKRSGDSKPRAPRAKGIRVLYEDADYIVVFKPAGLPVHGGSGITTRTLVEWVREHFAAPDSTYQPSPVHRIDRPASGLVVFAKTLRGHQYLARIFAEKSLAPEEAAPLEKVYLALVKGRPPAQSGRIELPVGLKKIPSGHDSSRFAVSEYKVIAERPPICLLELRPVQGRTHQLRLHLSAAGMPILGDRRYGGEFPGVYRALLHLWRLSFPSVTGKLMSFTADPPADFVKTMKRFSLSLSESGPPVAAVRSRQPPHRTKGPRK